MNTLFRDECSKEFLSATSIGLKRKYEGHSEEHVYTKLQPQCFGIISEAEAKSQCLESLKRLTPCLKIAGKKVTKKHVRFDVVHVYLFERNQGFTCVPSQGGSTLGMALSHWYTYTLLTDDYLVKRCHERRRQLYRQHCTGKVALSPEIVRRLELFFKEEGVPLSQATKDVVQREMEGLEDFYFMQPVSIRQRRSMLRRAGVVRIDPEERFDCQNIRTSREHCGCDCVSTCHPSTCQCAVEGITCQVDRVNFPCACTRSSCSNFAGRIEFNPVRVRSHYIHTQFRLSGMEQQDATVSVDAEQSQAGYNSTEQGTCRDCHNDKYMHMLMQEMSDTADVVTAASQADAISLMEGCLPSLVESEEAYSDYEEEEEEEVLSDMEEEEDNEEIDDDDDDDDVEVDILEYSSSCSSGSDHCDDHCAIGSPTYTLEPINVLLSSTPQQHLVFNNNYAKNMRTNCAPLGWALPSPLSLTKNEFAPTPSDTTQLTPLQPVDRSQLFGAYLHHRFSPPSSESLHLASDVSCESPVMSLLSPPESEQPVAVAQQHTADIGQVDLTLSILSAGSTLSRSTCTSEPNVSPPSFGEMLKKNICETSVSA